MKNLVQSIQDLPKDISNIGKTITDGYTVYDNSQTVIKKRKLDIAMRLKLLRQENKFSHEEVAEKTNIQKQTYSGYENGHNNTPIEALVRLADFYKVSMDYLTCRTDNKKGIFVTDKENTADNEVDLLKHEIEKIKEDLLKIKDTK